MARPPRFAISAVADLLHELRYAPPETLARQMQAAERLLNEIEPDRNYPEDYIRFRITAFRGERGDGSVFVGSALRGDLAKFIERISASLGWTAAQYAPRRPLLPEQVRRRLNVSAVTLHRYRKEGLVAHQVVLDEGRPRLVYFDDAVARFASRQGDSVHRAARFTRIDEETHDRMIRRARRYARSLDLSLNEAAKRLARRFGRSHEGVRRLLKRYDQSHADHPIFSDVGPLTDRQRHVILRAYDRSIPASEVAARLGKTVNTIYRTSLVQRAERLRRWDVQGAELSTFQLEGAEEVILSNPALSCDLPIALETGGDLVDWLEQAAALQIGDELLETQCIAGLHYLLWSTRRIIDRLDQHQPRAADIDAAETRLRWATRLRAKLLAGLRASLISTIEIHLGRKLIQSPQSEIMRAYTLAITAGGRAIDVFEPNRQGRLGQIAVHLLRTDLARQTDSAGGATASRAVRQRGSIHLPDLPQVFPAWRRCLELRPGAISVADRLEDTARSVVSARFGWDGRAPRTHVRIAEAAGRPVHRVAATEQRARRQLAQLLRERHRD